MQQLGGRATSPFTMDLLFGKRQMLQSRLVLRSSYPLVRISCFMLQALCHSGFRLRSGDVFFSKQKVANLVSSQ